MCKQSLVANYSRALARNWARSADDSFASASTRKLQDARQPGHRSIVLSTATNTFGVRWPAVALLQR
jgi:hypothetical protein